jgi:glycosyltransferase involved in cell wall biosynthesis
MSACKHSGEQGRTVSMLFLAFNQASFVEQAARTIIGQSGIAPLEILLSDDASTDATFEILQSPAQKSSNTLNTTEKSSKKPIEF